MRGITRCAMLLLLVGLVAMAGCSFVTAKDRAIIDEHLGNAIAINEKVQADETMPDWAKQWWNQEVRTWKAMSAWAAREAPDPSLTPEGE